MFLSLFRARFLRARLFLSLFRARLLLPRKIRLRLAFCVARQAIFFHILVVRFHKPFFGVRQITVFGFFLQVFIDGFFLGQFVGFHYLTEAVAVFFKVGALDGVKDVCIHLNPAIEDGQLVTFALARCRDYVTSVEAVFIYGYRFNAVGVGQILVDDFTFGGFLDGRLKVVHFAGRPLVAVNFRNRVPQPFIGHFAADDG